MRHRSRLVPAQVGLALSLALVLGAFRVPWHAEAPAPRPAAPPEGPALVVDVPATRPTAPTPPPDAAPPVEVPDAVEEGTLVQIPFPAPPRRHSGSVQPPPPPPPPPPPLRVEYDEPFVEIAEVMPELQGGVSGLQARIPYPEFARRVGIEGRVYVRFIVNTDGTVSDVEVLRGIGGGCDEAAVAAVRASRFTPGLQRGRPVRVRMALPVTFRLQ